MPENNLNAPAAVEIFNPTAINAQSGLFAAGGPGMKLLRSGFDVQALRTLDVLRNRDWVAVDNAVVDVARAQLLGIADLLARGLTFPLPNALGVTRVEWERISDMDPAEISMAGVTEGRNDRVLFDLQSIPIPIVHKDFWINIRALEASRRGGTPLDTTQVRLATRKVSERLEDILFNGTTAIGTNTPIYGYLTAPNRNTGSVTASWATTATGAQMIADVLAMIGKSTADNMYGPWMIYVPIPVWVRLLDDFKANSDKSIISRILEIPGIMDVKATSQLTASNILMVQMSSDVVDLIDGMQPTVVQWQEMGGMIFNFKVMAIEVPRIRNDILTQSGIVHYS